MIDVAPYMPRQLKMGDQSINHTFDPMMIDEVYVPSVLIGLWVHFTDVSGSGVSLKTLAVKIDSYDGPTWDQCVESRENVGIATGSIVTDYVLTVTADYALKYFLGLDPVNPNKHDKVHVTWTNDDAGNIRWGIKALIVPVSALG